MNKFKSILMSVVFVLISGACTKKSIESDILNIDKSFAFPKGFPVDPGEAGKVTLAGIDSDSDGVRDDVQRWIYARYSDDVSKRRALTQMAKSLQIDCSRDYRKEEINSIMPRDSRDLDCLVQVFKPNSLWHLESEALRAKVFNTKRRSEQYLKNDKLLDGKTTGQTNQNPESFCDK